VAEHDGELYSVLAGLRALAVVEGVRVRAGERLGEAGSRELLFQVRHGVVPIDPVLAMPRRAGR
jgi:murein DD-endopeptidase MepM/ murein hydrolase activator NlpD